MKTKLVLFDIDGTLLLTAGAGRRAITAALRRHIPDPAVCQHVRFDGKTDPQIVEELLAAAGHQAPATPERVEEVCQAYVELLASELKAGQTRTTLMPGVGPLLERLETESTVVLGLLTGNIAEGARLKLQSAGLAPDRFPVGAFGSDSPRRPELPAVAARRAMPLFGREPTGAEVVIIGDTPADVTCGAAIGARAIAVATGSYPTAALAAAGAYAVFENLADTDLVLQAILA